DKERKTKLFGDITETLKFPKERVDKDLALYNSNIEKLEQALAVMKDLAEAAKRDREKAATPTEPPASSEAPSENAPTPVE
ncbi:MAG: photosystem II biogenesis protein Psp29, partial [Cyanobacteria bacterium J06555_12]